MSDDTGGGLDSSSDSCRRPSWSTGWWAWSMAFPWVPLWCVAYPGSPAKSLLGTNERSDWGGFDEEATLVLKSLRALFLGVHVELLFGGGQAEPYPDPLFNFLVKKQKQHSNNIWVYEKVKKTRKTHILSTFRKNQKMSKTEKTHFSSTFRKNLENDQKHNVLCFLNIFWWSMKRQKVVFLAFSHFWWFPQKLLTPAWTVFLILLANIGHVGISSGLKGQ